MAHCSVTQLGVSEENVVATIDNPASHHGTDRPDAKNSVVLDPERLARNRAGTKHTRMVTATMAQSIQETFMREAAGEGRTPDGALSRVSGMPAGA